MRKLRRMIGLVVVLVVGGIAYVWFSGGSGQPSTEVTAPPITEAPEDNSEEMVVEDPDPDEPTTTTTVAGGEADEAAEVIVFEIDRSESSVRFEIDEVLNGNPKRVVGTTSEVAGEVLVDFRDPSRSILGTVVINVRTLETDSSFRDRAIRGPILGSAQDEIEFASFEPQAVEGLPEQVGIGDTMTLVVTGDLSLSGVTRSVVFDVQVSVVSKDRLEVTGSATVHHSDFGLLIPDVPSVSDVAEEVTLVIDLVATV